MAYSYVISSFEEEYGAKIQGRTVESKLLMCYHFSQVFMAVENIDQNQNVNNFVLSFDY